MGRAAPGRLWTHNDSADPVLFSLDTNGKVTARVQVTGAEVHDWEAVGAGSCPTGSCLYIADIGDNDARRQHIIVYRLPEPKIGEGSVRVTDVYRATYPDGAHDAESLLVAADGRLYVITKGDTGEVAIYRFPANPRAGDAMALERIGGGAGSRKDRITDAALSPDGEWAALRTNEAIVFYRGPDLLAGRWREEGRIDLTPIGEPQGEGLAFGSDNIIYLAGEGGGTSRAGTFARLTCTPRR
jgi:hypothetical protein